MEQSVASRFQIFRARLKRYRAHFAVVFLVAAALAAACSGSGPVAAVFGGAAVVLLIGVGTASGYREYRKRQLLSRRWVLSFLKARGLDPEEDADGDVLFLLDNMKYVLHIKEHYFELHIGFGRKRSELNDELMTRMAQEVMSSTRMVKILLRPEAVLFSIECLQCRKSEFAGFFDSYIRILKFSVAELIGTPTGSCSLQRRTDEPADCFLHEIFMPPRRRSHPPADGMAAAVLPAIRLG